MKIFRLIRLLRLVIREKAQEEKLKDLVKTHWPDVQAKPGLFWNGLIDKIKIGKGSKINQSVYLNVGGESNGGHGSITIGENTIVGVSTTIYAGGAHVNIGDFVDIGVGALILAHSRMSSYDPKSTETDEKFDHLDIKIGNCCNIASGAIVLGGSEIGDYSIVGAGAVVQGIYPAYSTLMPMQARRIPRIVKNHNDN